MSNENEGMPGHDKELNEKETSGSEASVRRMPFWGCALLMSAVWVLMFGVPLIAGVIPNEVSVYVTLLMVVPPALLVVHLCGGRLARRRGELSKTEAFVRRIPPWAWALLGSFGWVLVLILPLVAGLIPDTWMPYVIVFMAIPPALLIVFWGGGGLGGGGGLASPYGDTDKGIKAMEDWKWRLRRKRVKRRESRKRGDEGDA